MKSGFIEVFGSTMHFRECGEGQPILFIHGNPTSSYLWRNIMPALESRGRCIAVDLIGMGKSDKPDIGYRIVDHYRYLDEFIRQLGLRDILLVVHDWGSALGFHYCKNNPLNVRGVAFMEAQTRLRGPLDTLGGEGDFFRPLRDPVTGPKMIMDDNFFMNQGFTGGMLVSLSDEDLAVYREPFLTRESRKPLYVFPNEVPIGGEPADVTKMISEYMDFLASNELPKLLLYAEGGAVTTPEEVARLTKLLPNMKKACIGRSIHFVQEDCPEAISNELNTWIEETFE